MPTQSKKAFALRLDPALYAAIERLAAAEQVNVHPLRNTATLGLSGKALISFMAGTGHEPVVTLLPARA